jgi:hypothetical protein
MAPKDGWERLREREDQEEREREEALQAELLKKRLQPGGKKSDAGVELVREASIQSSGGSTEKLVELMDRVEPLLDQVRVLYAQYFSGAERLPPIERRKQLDQVMNALSLMAKPTQVHQFRFKALQARYQSFCEQWERKLRDVESGKGPARPISRAK